MNNRDTFFKFFFDWSCEEQEKYIDNLVKAAGGGFILMDSGGVPKNITPESFEKIRHSLTECAAGGSIWIAKSFEYWS